MVAHKRWNRFSESRDIARLFEFAELGEIDQSFVVFVSAYFAGYEYSSSLRQLLKREQSLLKHNEFLVCDCLLL